MNAQSAASRLNATDTFCGAHCFAFDGWSSSREIRHDDDGGPALSGGETAAVECLQQPQQRTKKNGRAKNQLVLGRERARRQSWDAALRSRFGIDTIWGRFRRDSRKRRFFIRSIEKEKCLKPVTARPLFSIKTDRFCSFFSAILSRVRLHRALFHMRWFQLVSFHLNGFEDREYDSGRWFVVIREKYAVSSLLIWKKNGRDARFFIQQRPVTFFC